MDTQKQKLFDAVDAQRGQLLAASDDIFDHPEVGGREERASALLAGMLRDDGFTVETGVAGLPTAFRAVYQQGGGGPSIGLLCEYDAIEGLGHGCAHHMQGPSCVGAARAVKAAMGDRNYTLVVYGTPAEETFGGKIDMIREGYFKDIDVALMMHGGPDTCTDIKSLAMSEYLVTYHGKAAHAAIAPDQGRSALDALLLAFNGIEFLREHVKDDIRMHYTITELPGANNVVPDTAKGSFALRSYDREELDGVIERFRDIIKGAALMAGVEYELKALPAYDNKIPVTKLNDCVMANAAACGAPGLAPAREKTGSTDFGNVLHRMPGSCIRVQFVASGTSSHSVEWLDAGKSEAGHAAVIYGAKILAGTAMDLIENPELLKAIKEQFRENSGQKKG